MSELFSRVREVGYYGKSQSFSIGTQTNNLSLSITLQPTGTDINTGGGSTDTPTELEGTWKTACFTNADNSSNIDTLTFSGNVVTKKDEKHSDTSCATDYSLVESSHTFSIGAAMNFPTYGSSGGSGHRFTVTIGSTEKTTPQSASAVNAFNSSSECGYSNWELNTEKNCSIDDAGDPAYGLYLLDGNSLYLDVDDSSYPSSIYTSDTSGTFVKQ